MPPRLRVFGHPLHAMLSDAPIALLGSSIVWDATGLVRGETIWWTIGYWNVALGVAAAAMAAVAGLVDFASIDEKHPAARTAQLHMLAALGAVGLYVGSLLARGGQGEPAGWRLAITVAIDAVGFALLSAAGWLGGHLVFRFGVGRDEGN